MTTQPTVLQTIEDDLKSLGNWLETEAKTAALTVWNTGKSLFTSLTSQQVPVLIGLAEKAIAESGTGASIETIVVGIVKAAEAAELPWISSIPANVLAAYAALVKHQLGA